MSLKELRKRLYKIDEDIKSHQFDPEVIKRKEKFIREVNITGEDLRKFITI